MKGRTARKDGGSAYANGPESSNEKGVKVSDTDKGANWYSGEDSNVKGEAEQKTGFKKGGKVSAFKRGKEAEGISVLRRRKSMRRWKETSRFTVWTVRSALRVERSPVRARRLLWPRRPRSARASRA